MNLDDFGRALDALQVGTGKTMTPEQIEVWFQCLKDLPLPALQTAITRYLCEGDDWPSIAKIRKLAGSAMYGECLSFGESFDAMLSAIRQHGSYNEQAARAKLDGLTWISVQGLGGWDAVCDSPTDQRSTLRAQFRMVYEGLRQREESHRALPESVRPRIENPGQGRIEYHESVRLFSESMNTKGDSS